jgi:hypothetical protein
MGSELIGLERPVHLPIVVGRIKGGEINTWYPFACAALKIRSIFSTVPFSVTLAPTAP